MSLSYDNNGNLVMPVSPMGYGNNSGFLGGDGAWWLIVLLLIGWGGNGFGNGFGGNSGAPYMINNDVQRGFDQSAIMNGFTGVNAAINNLNTGMNAAFANAETAANARQIASMQQAFDLSSQFANCCCENRLAVANLTSDIAREACADRQAVSDLGVQLSAQINNAFTALQMQNYQDKLDAKNERIASLENQLNAAQLEASNNARTLAQTAELERYLNPTPIPAYQVQNPNCCANMYNYGCGCNG